MSLHPSFHQEIFPWRFTEGSSWSFFNQDWITCSLSCREARWHVRLSHAHVQLEPREPGTDSRLSCVSPTTVVCLHTAWSVVCTQWGHSKWQGKKWGTRAPAEAVLTQPYASRVPGEGSDFVIEASSDEEPGLISLPLIQKVTGDAEPEVFLHLTYKGRQPPRSWHRTHQTPNPQYKSDFLPQRWGVGGGRMGLQNQTASSMNSKQEIKQTAVTVVLLLILFLFVSFAEVGFKEIRSSLC